jgi:hypothetical protein
MIYESSTLGPREAGPPLEAARPAAGLGSRARAVTAMVYEGKAVYVKHVFTHPEYDKWNKKRR